MAAGVLLVTARDALAAGIGRLAALAGASCEVARDSGAARAAWRQAAIVLVDGDVVAALASAGLPRCDRLFVVTDGPLDGARWQAALSLGARRVFELPAHEPVLVEELRAADRPVAELARVIGVVGGCGGAGVSTFAAALALAASTSGPTVLVDGDPLGGGLDVLLGAESVPGLRWSDLSDTRGRVDPGSFAGALCRVAGVAVLAWGRDVRVPVSDAAVDAVLDAARHGFANVVLDLPRSWGRVADRLADAVDATTLLVPAEVRAVAAASSLLAAVGSRLLTPCLVVRDPGGADLSARDVGDSLGLAVTATLRSDAAVRQAARRGEPPIRGSRGALARACAAVLADVTAGQPG